MVNVPADIAWGKVVGVFLNLIGASTDEDDYPDVVKPLGMKVKFARVQPVIKTTTPLATLMAQVFECTVSDDGVMTDINSKAGQWLPLGIYSVSYSGGNGAVSLPTHLIEVTADHTAIAPLDLTTAAPAPVPATPTEYLELDGRVTVLENADPGAGGGGSGPVGLIQLYNSTVVQSAITGGTKATFANWAENVMMGDAFGLTTDPAIPGWAYDEAGWYQVNFKLWVGFTAGATALPDYFRVSFISWAGLEIDQEVRCHTNDNFQFGAFRQVPGATLTMTSPAYYSPGTDVAPMGDQPNSIELGWPGDATLTGGNGAAAQNALRVNVIKLA